jgi:hypothetical protein
VLQLRVFGATQTLTGVAGWLEASGHGHHVVFLPSAIAPSPAAVSASVEKGQVHKGQLVADIAETSAPEVLTHLSGLSIDNADISVLRVDDMGPAIPRRSEVDSYCPLWSSRRWSRYSPPYGWSCWSTRLGPIACSAARRARARADAVLKRAAYETRATAYGPANRSTKPAETTRTPTTTAITPTMTRQPLRQPAPIVSGSS